jgi:hypothetical protein
MIQLEKPSWTMRTLNRLAGGRTFIDRAELGPEALVERAVRRAGCDDLGSEPGLWEGLDRLCRSAKEEAALNPFGRVAMGIHTVNALVSRLLRVQARRRYPERFEASLDRPLFVVGLPRSGTTLLHRLLSLDPEARALTTWEVRKPLPEPGTDLRRAATRAQIAMLKLSAPGIDAKHHIDADEPEECVFLLDSTLKSPSFWMMAPVYGYNRWFTEQDMLPAYRGYREHLQLFQRETPGRRLVLKAPAHTLFLNALLAAIPEALVVQTHRDPLPIVGSVNSLFVSFHGAVSTGMDVPRMARVNLQLLEDIAQRSLELRDRAIPGELFDLRYDDLAADPTGQVERIYLHFGLPFTERYRETLRQWLEARPRHRFGRHRYSLEDFGFSPGELAERFEPYRKRFLEP